MGKVVEVCAKDILKNKSTWKSEFNERYEYLKKYFGEKKCFKTMYRVKISDGNVLMNLSEYIVNLIMWRPMIRYKIQPSMNTLFDTTCIKQSTISDYINSVYVRPLRSKVDINKLNLEIAKIIEGLKKIEEDFGLIIGVTFNYYQIIQLIKKNPRVRELITTEIPEGMQPKEIEVYLKGRRDELIEILKKSDTGFGPLLRSGVGINPNQLQELMVAVGNKPDLTGKTYPVPINTNLMFKGLDNPTHYIIDASAGHKALIMNKKFTGSSGYFSRKLNLLNLDTALDSEESDCHTDRYLEVYIEDLDILKRYEGRYYKSKKESKILKVIKFNDTHLVGRKIYVRSPIYCQGHNGKICKKCYGELYNNNKEINIGVLAGTIITSRFTQNILSSKHSLMTNSQKIELTPGYDEFFILDSSSLLLDKNNIFDLKNYYLCIDSNDLEADVMDEYDEDEEIPLSVLEELTATHCSIVTEDGELIIELKEQNGMHLKVTNYMRNLINHFEKKSDDDNILIPLNSIDENETLFEFDIANHELTKTLNQVKDLLEKKEHQGCESIEEMVGMFNRLLIDGKIYAMAIHSEIIIRNLIRNPKDITLPPNWSDKDAEYVILTVQKALMENPSPLISLSYERVEEQLRKVLTFRKFKPSIIDKLFMKKYKSYYNVDVDNYKIG